MPAKQLLNSLPKDPLSHFELPVLEEIKNPTPLSHEGSVFMYNVQPLANAERAATEQPLCDFSTQTLHCVNETGTDQTSNIAKEELYRFVPLPLSQSPTPSTSVCSLH